MLSGGGHTNIASVIDLKERKGLGLPKNSIVTGIWATGPWQRD